MASLTPNVHVLPPLGLQLKSWSLNLLLTPSFGLPKPAFVFMITVLTFQEKSAVAYSCGRYYLNRDNLVGKIFLSTMLWE